MYTPAHFAETRLDVLHQFIRQHPLAALVTSGPDGLEATHVPMVLHPEIGPRGVLRCHVARANPQWKSIGPQRPALVIFSGPEHYITPSWYAAKKEHGRVVPTWNYAAVHVSGQAKLFEEENALLEHLNALTKQSEAPFENPWAVSDAPPEYVQAMAKAIVGIEMTIERLEGKWKASQNRPRADRPGIIAGLEELHTPQSLEMAEMVKLRCE
ncbi:MAG TPA: FMN-binding negative transcriptional regulator [Bryobacteraceae bacterium]